MTKEKKSERQIFIDGDLDGIPIDMENVRQNCVDLSDDPDFDFSKKLGITDNLYLATGIDLRKLKKLNPKNHVIF